MHRGYPDNLVNTTLTEVNFCARMSPLRIKINKKIAVCYRMSPVSA